MIVFSDKDVLVIRTTALLVSMAIVFNCVHYFEFHCLISGLSGLLLLRFDFVNFKRVFLIKEIQMYISSFLS